MDFKRITTLLSLPIAMAPVYGAIIGNKATTPLTLPYSQTFDSAESVNDFTIIDDNNDGIYWKWENNEMGCSQNPNKPMDDWLVMRPVYLNANTDYFFSMKARRYRASEPERFEVYMGNDAASNALMTEIIGPTVPADAYGATYEKTIRVSTSGYYYIGIHGISDKWKTRLCVDNISLVTGANDAAPGAPAQLSAIPDASGDLRAEISFTTPIMDVLGNSISTLTKAVVLRDGNEIKTFENPQPGETLNYIDEAVTAGDHTYGAVAYNDAGIGTITETTVYVGLRMPGYPENVQLAETPNYGEVTLTWDAPTTDRSGNQLDPSKVTYRIVEYIGGETPYTIADNIQGTSYTFRAVEEGARQEFKEYSVYAATNGGENNIPTRSNTVAVGTPTALPFRESFNTDLGETDNPLASMTTTGVAIWNFYDDGQYALGSIKSQDNDNGYIAMYAQNLNYAGRIFTAKIDLSETSHPAATFYTYIMGEGDNNSVDFQIRPAGSSAFSSISSVSLNEFGPEERWVKITVPLTRYAGRVIQAGILATTITDAYTPIDNFRIFDMKEKDAVIASFDVPSRMEAGKECSIVAAIENNGYTDLEDLTVSLYRDDEEIQVSEPISILSGETATVEFSLGFGIFETGNHFIKAIVNCPEDGNPDDNETEVAQISVEYNDYPVVTGLYAEAIDGGVAIHAVGVENEVYQPAAVLDDFERYPAFANENVGPWTFYDGDQGYIGGIGSGDNTLDFPGISGQQSWWVMDGDYRGILSVGYPQFWEAHSGSKYLMQEYVTNESITEAVACDDWIISPELSGAAQTISFWAKSYNRNHPESFNVMISSTDDNPASFTFLDLEVDIEDSWEKFTYTLPAGTKYFAIVCVSFYQMAMFVDDISYIPGGSAVMPELKGYNIYRDHAKLNTNPVQFSGDIQTALYEDRDCAVGSHVYHVTALYDKGESAPSEPLYFDFTSVKSLPGLTDQYSSTRYFTLQGIELEGRPAQGTICIVVKDGKTSKIMIP